MSDFKLPQERQKSAVETLQSIGRAIAVELKDVGVPTDDHIGYYGRVPRPGWLNQVFGRTTIDFINVDGWTPGIAPVEDTSPILLSDNGEIFVMGSGISSSAEGHPLTERHVTTINAARSIQKSLHLIEERHSLQEKLRAKRE